MYSPPPCLPSSAAFSGKNVLPAEAGRIDVLDRVIGTAYLGALGKDTLFTAALEIFLPHPVKPPCVELSAAKPPFSQKHFPKTDLGNFLGFGDRIFGEMENRAINFIALFIEI